MTKKQLWNKLRKLQGNYKHLGKNGMGLFVGKYYTFLIIYYYSGGCGSNYKGKRLIRTFEEYKKENLIKLIKKLGGKV